MRQLYFKQVTKLLFCFTFLFSLQHSFAQATPNPGTMTFGTATVAHAFNVNDASVDHSIDALFNGFDMSSTGTGIILAFANNGNGGGTDAIGAGSDAVLTWLGDAADPITSGTLSTDSGNEIGLTSMQFAYAQALGGSTMNFTISGMRDGSEVGTIVLTSPTHNSAISIDFTSPTTGSFINIDQLVITPASSFFGGFSIDDLVVVAASTNTDPTINIDNSTLAYTEGNTATQIDGAGTVNDTDGDADWDGGTLQVQITANAEAADELSISDTDGDGTAITISGTNILANGTDIGDLSTSGGTVTNGTMLTITFDSDATNANVQEVLQSLRYRNTSASPGTSNRTVTITANDTNGGTANDTRTISITAAPDVTSVVVPTDNVYVTADDLTFSVIFNENITVNTAGGTPQLDITIGSTARVAEYISGSGTVLLLFRYTVQSGEIDTDGIAVGSLSANGGTLQNGSGTNANLTLNGVGSTLNVLVDAVAPTDPVVNTPASAVTVNAATQTLSGTHTENGVTVHAYADSDNDGTADNTTSLGSATVTGNAWSFSVNLTADSANNFVVEAQDTAGNTSNDIDVPTITEDSTNPVDPVVNTPASAVTVNAATQTLSGTHTENGVTVHAYADNDNDGAADNTTSLGSATVTGNTWSFSVNLTADSANNFVVEAEDAAGNTSNDVDVPTITETSAIAWTGTDSNSWNTASNWNINAVPVASSDVTIPNGITNYPTISSSVTVNSINIASGASLIANASVTATVTYSRNLPTTNWYLVAAPVSGETQQDVIANHTFASGTGANIGIGAYTNNGASPWVYATNATIGPLVSGAGVSMKLAAAGNVSITGTINTSNVSFPIATGTRNNFNLVGNPFTSFVNSSSFASVNTGILSEETVWLWDGTQYVTYNAVSPIEIAPAQGFFVEASGSGNIAFSTANQSHQTTDTFMRQTPKPSFELFAESEDNKKGTKVFFVNGKTTGFDNGYDSKLFNGASQDFGVFTQLVADDKGNHLAIQTLPNSDLETMVIPLGLTAEAGKEITFSVATTNLPSGIEIYLEDRINNTFINLSEENHSITTKTAVNGIGQYYIHTTSQRLSTNDITQNIANVSIYKSSEQEVTITGLQAEANVKVFSLLGKRLVDTNINSNGLSTVALPNLPTGVYVVKLNSVLGNITKKIIVE